MKKGLESLKGVAIQYLFKDDSSEVQSNDREENPDQSNLKDNCKSPDNLDYVNNEFFSSQCDQESPNSNIESLIFKRNKEIDAEILYLSALLANPKVIDAKSSTNEFWLKYRTNMPKLFDLQVILLNIPASSSFIERFFSISGIVCDSRRLNMNDELIVMRSLMKANMSILNDLQEIG